MKARWIRLGSIGQAQFDAAYVALAAAQPRAHPEAELLGGLARERQAQDLLR